MDWHECEYDEGDRREGLDEAKKKEYLYSFLLFLSLRRVGKTSLMNQYVNKKFSNQYKATSTSTKRSFFLSFFLVNKKKDSFSFLRFSC